MKIASLLRLIASAAFALLSLGLSAHADTLDDIKKAGKIRIAIDLAIPPFGMTDDKMQPTGSDVDLARLLAKDMGVELEIVTTTGPTRIPMLQTNKADIVVSTLSITPDRAKVIDFTKPYYVSPSQFVALKSSGITDDPSTLKGKTVGVQSGTNHQSYMEQKLPDITEKVYNTVQEAELDLESGRIDAMLADKLLMYDWLVKAGNAKGFDYVGKPVVDPLVAGQVGIGVKKGNAGLQQSLNAAIDQLLADPAYDKIATGHFPFSIRP